MKKTIILLLLLMLCLVTGCALGGKTAPSSETESGDVRDTEHTVSTESEIGNIENTETDDTQNKDTESSGTDNSSTENSDTENSSTESGDAQIGKPEDDHKNDDNNIEDTKPEDPKPENAKPENTKPENTKPENTKPEDTKPSTKPSTTPNRSHPYYIKVNRVTNTVTVYSKDENGNYMIPVKAMVCSVGSNDGTPVGVYETKAKYEWRALFNNCYGQYATRITGHILFHSVPYRNMDKSTLITDYYNELGSSTSAGCIRLSVEDAKWIYDNCGIGVTVEIYDSNEPGPLGKPESILIDVNSPFAGWDPTDPDPRNPWINKTPTILGVKNLIVGQNQVTDYISYVSATDSEGRPLTVSVEGTVDFSKCGTYIIKYYAEDEKGNRAEEKAMIIVQNTLN